MILVKMIVDIKLFVIVVLFLLMACSGCSTVKVVPEAVENGVVNQNDGSLTISRNGLEVTVRPEASTINSYNLENTVTAFQVMIRNNSGAEAAFAEDSFVLADEQGLQYALLTPEKVREMIKKDSYYLMPYPYVGFYYLEDFQKTSFYNKFNTALPYYYELYPQDLFTRFLPMSSVIPGMKVEGLVYFRIDMSAHQNVRLMLFRKGASKSAQPELSFPFRIVR